jgi:hypothetical protein
MGPRHEPGPLGTSRAGQTLDKQPAGTYKEVTTNMSIRKSLIATAAMALAMMGLASSAMAATDGVIRDVTTNGIVPLNHETRFKGWARFGSESGGTKCHSESVAKATNSTGTTGTASFVVPSVAATACTSEIPGCTLTAVEVTNSPYHMTVTPTDIDVTGNIVIHNKYTGTFCFFKEITIEFSSITLKPLNTTNARSVTNTNNKIGNTAAAGEPIAGVELSGTGTSPQVGKVEATGEMEVTGADLCTWKIAAS